MLTSRYRTSRDLAGRKMNHFHSGLAAVCATLGLSLGAGVTYADSLPAGLTAADIESTRSMAGALLNDLGQTLKKTVASDGPIAAVVVCKEVAPSIAAKLSAQHGAEVKRVGTRARNPATGTPSAWQTAALAEFESRLGQGEKPNELEYWRVVEDAQGNRALHFAKAIMTQQLCVTCHGDTEDIPAPLLEKIRTEYPQDKAIGYRVGQLRGAVVVTRPLPGERLNR